MKWFSASLAMLGFVFGGAGSLNAEVLFAYNEDAVNYTAGVTWPYSIGWLWEAPSDFNLTGIEFRFGLGSSNKRLTIAVYDNLPESGGTLLASAEYDQVGGTWGGADISPVPMLTGEDYLIGLWNAEGLHSYLDTGEHVGSGWVYYDVDGEPPPSFSESYFGNQDIIAMRVHGAIPEPSALVLLGVGAVCLLAYAWRRRRFSDPCVISRPRFLGRYTMKNMKIMQVVLLLVLFLSAAVARAASVAEVENNDSFAAAQDLNPFFTPNVDPNVFGALPTASVLGTNASTSDVDYYRFDMTTPGIGYFDIDNGMNDVDATLSLFDAGFNVLAVNDDSSPMDPGSIHGLDSFVGVYNFASPGTYYLAVSNFSNFPLVYGTYVEDLTRPDGAYGGSMYLGDSGPTAVNTTNGQYASGDYTLHASITPEPSTLILLGVGAVCLLAYAWRRGVRRRCPLLLVMLCPALSLLSVGAGSVNADVIAVVDTPDTFVDEDAWTITNQMSARVSQAILTFTPESYGNFDDNLPSQASSGFVVNPISDPTGVSASYADASSAPANFHGWRSLVLTFSDFDPGESLVFQADTDGSIGTTPPSWGNSSGDAFSGILQLAVTFEGGGTGVGTFWKSGTYASTASAAPEPSAIVLLGIGAVSLLAYAWRRRRFSDRWAITCSPQLQKSKIMSTIVCVVALTYAVHAGAAPIQLITNGGFETGDFTGWSVTDLAGGSGSWFIDDANGATPFSGLSTVGPAAGSFYAVSDQGGPGTHILEQSFTVPVGVTSVALSFDMFRNDWGSGPIVDPVGLDHTGPSNQHARVDIMTALAGAFSTFPVDIVANLVAPGVDGSVDPNPYTAYLFDITGFVAPGTTYKLRFGEVDNMGNFNQGVDNVSILAETIPEPSAIVLLGVGAFSLLAYAWRRGVRRRCLLLLVMLCPALSLLSVGAGSVNADVIAVVDTPDTWGDLDAWTITNQTPVRVLQAAFTFKPWSFWNFDDNKPFHASYGFSVDPGSDPTDVSASWANHSPAPFNFHGWRSLILTFNDFDPGESLVFQADTDSGIGMTPPFWGACGGDTFQAETDMDGCICPMPPFCGAHSGNAFSGILQLAVTLEGGGTSVGTFWKSGPCASTACAAPEPSAIVLLGVGAVSLLAHAWRKRRVRKTFEFTAALVCVLGFGAICGTATIGEGCTLTSVPDVGSYCDAANPLDGVPDYKWWYGCSPTAGGMMVGYWDGKPGFGNLYEGDAGVWGGSGASGTRSMVASTAHIAAGGENGYTYGDWHNSASYPNHEANPDCIADFMHTVDGSTSWSGIRNGLEGYIEWDNPATGTNESYEADVSSNAVDYYGGTFTYGDFKDEIDNDRPVQLSVRCYHGGGWVGHSVVGYGYQDDMFQVQDPILGNVTVGGFAIMDTWSAGAGQSEWVDWTGTGLVSPIINGGVEWWPYLEGRGSSFTAPWDWMVANATTLTITPEPSTLVLLGIGAVSLLAYAWRRRRA